MKSCGKIIIFFQKMGKNGKRHHLNAQIHKKFRTGLGPKFFLGMTKRTENNFWDEQEDRNFNFRMTEDRSDRK